MERTEISQYSVIAKPTVMHKMADKCQESTDTSSPKQFSDTPTLASRITENAPSADGASTDINEGLECQVQ